MDVMQRISMTAKEVIAQNNEILRSIALTPDQREEYGKICAVIDNNNVCLAAWEREDMEKAAKNEPIAEDTQEVKEVAKDEATAEDIQEVKEDAVPAVE